MRPVELTIFLITWLTHTVYETKGVFTVHWLLRFIGLGLGSGHMVRAGQFGHSHFRSLPLQKQKLKVETKIFAIAVWRYVESVEFLCAGESATFSAKVVSKCPEIGPSWPEDMSKLA